MSDKIEEERQQIAQLLFEQLQKMKNCNAEEFEVEMARGKIMSVVAGTIIASQKVALAHAHTERRIGQLDGSIGSKRIEPAKSAFPTKTGYVAGMKLLTAEEKQRNIDATYEDI